MDKTQLLSKEKVPKALVKLGIPTMVGMMVSYLYNVVDTYFVGTLGTIQQAAVAAVFPLSMIFLGIGLLFGTGAGSYLARILGKGEREKANQCASTAVALSVGTALILVIIMLLAINPILHLLGCTDNMIMYARQYAIPFIIGLVINVFNATMSNLTTAEGAPLYSMRSMLIGGIVNIVLDPVLIIVFKMGVVGAAYATLIARIVSLSSYMLFLLMKKSQIHYSIKNIHVEKELVIQISKIGVPSMIYQILCSTSLMMLNNQAKPFGESVIAACGIVSRIVTLGAMTMMGFLKGYQTFAGYNYGAKQYDRVNAATKVSIIWTTVFCVVCAILFIVFRKPVISAFNADDSNVLKIGSLALIFNSVTFLTMGFQMVYASKFMGLGKGMYGGLVSLGRQGFFFIPCVYILPAIWGLNGLLLAQPVADILSFVLVIYLARKDHNFEKEWRSSFTNDRNIT